LKKRKKPVPAVTANTTIARSAHCEMVDPLPVGRGTTVRLALVGGMLAWVCSGSMDSAYLVGTLVGAAVGVGDGAGVGVGVAVGVGISKVGVGVQLMKHP
jgi:hypothetical protein